ncbi:hypothetical protein CDS [Bradyrhizobium sp.]|nr:hypothetical protein CDS [Bradyrhizobium sp.]
MPSRVPGALQRPSRCCAEPGPRKQHGTWWRNGPRLSSAPLRAALRPGHETVFAHHHL